MKRNHSLGLRIWHWVDAALVVGLLSTYFLRKHLVSNLKYFRKQLFTQSNIDISDSLSKPIMNEIVQQLWNWHIYLGYALALFFVIRMILFFTDKQNPILECWNGICEFKTHFDFRNIHHTGVKIVYLIFYFLQLFMILSGLILTFHDSLGIQGQVKELLSETHESLMWFFLGFIIVHVFGVFSAENRDDPGITSSMINGK